MKGEHMANGEQEREELQGGEPTDEKVVAEQPLSVDLSDDGDDEPEEKAAAEPSDRKGKRQRFRELREKASASEERATRLERELAELRGRVEGIRQSTPVPRQEETTDPVEAELDGIESQKDALMLQMRQEGITEERFERLRKDYRALERKWAKIAAQGVVKEQQPAYDPVAHENNMLASEYPDVFNDPVRLQEAKTELMKLKRAGKPINYVTAREAARIVSQRYARPRSTPSPTDQARHTSVPSRAGATGASSRWTPTKLEINSARAFTQHLEGLSDEERLKLWAKKVGKKHGLVG